MAGRFLLSQGADFKHSFWFNADHTKLTFSRFILAYNNTIFFLIRIFFGNSLASFIHVVNQPILAKIIHFLRCLCLFVCGTMLGRITVATWLLLFAKVYLGDFFVPVLVGRTQILQNLTQFRDTLQRGVKLKTKLSPFTCYASAQILDGTYFSREVAFFLQSRLLTVLAEI